MGNHNIRLALSFILMIFPNMKTQKAIHTNSIRRLLLMVPVICSMSACSDVAGTAGTHPTANLQTAAVGEPQTGDDVTIGPRTYNSETREFDRPGPFWSGIQSAVIGNPFFSCWEIQQEIAAGPIRQINIPGLRIQRMFSWTLPSGELGGLSGEF